MRNCAPIEWGPSFCFWVQFLPRDPTMNRYDELYDPLEMDEIKLYLGI